GDTVVVRVHSRLADRHFTCRQVRGHPTGGRAGVGRPAGIPVLPGRDPLTGGVVVLRLGEDIPVGVQLDVLIGVAVAVLINERLDAAIGTLDHGGVSHTVVVDVMIDLGRVLLTLHRDRHVLAADATAGRILARGL